MELRLGVLFLKNLKNWNLSDFLKNGDFGDLLMVVCTDECSVIPRWILIFGKWNEHILELRLGVLFLAPSQPIWLRAIAIPHSVRPSVRLLTFEVQ